MFTSFKLPKPGPAPELPLATSHAPGPAHHPFSVSSLRPPLPHFSSPQFGSGQEPINLGPSLAAAARAEQGEGPTAPGPPGPEDVQKIQENNNNNQSEGESNSDEVTPPKNQGLIKVMSETQPGLFPAMLLTCYPANLLPAQARGTYFPLTAFPTSMPQGSVMRRDSSPPPTEKSVYGEWHYLYLNYHNVDLNPCRGDESPGVDEVQDHGPELHGVGGKGDRVGRQCPGEAPPG